MKGKSVARSLLQAVFNVADLVAKSVASVVAIHTISCLQSLWLPQEVQPTLQELLFEGSLLFVEQTNSELHGLKNSWAI